ncbi:hypothetical protein [Sphingomonas carotinifaciens]|uniref:hypothetical protein n=1 Tax=Sphingomonas carotinifaciens TaxID=1166323 RepID=UPI0012378119|nr:hypothetical protein [Sphingomonas carotinifaciens]
MHSSAVVVAAELNIILSNLRSMTGFPPDAPFNTIWNWQQPAVSRIDLELYVTDASAAIGRLPMEIPDYTAALLTRLGHQLSFFRSSVLPNLVGSNAMYVVPHLIEMTERAQKIVNGLVSPYPPPPPPPPFPDWEQLAADGYLPRKLADRLRGMERRVDALMPRTDELEEKLRIVDDAYSSAEQLPENLATLAENMRALASSRTEAQSLAAEAATHARDASKANDGIAKLAAQAEEKFADLANAYQAASTHGLASSFQQRASDLNWSVRAWVAVLIFDLAAGAGIGYFRFEALQNILVKPQTSSVIWGNIIFSILSLAAPVWLGWVATKQINQRFKLAEDYGFKATVAAAYEAWKTEAQKQDSNKQDKKFEERLFGTAMSRIEEAPLRFVEAENYGSPWQELTSSPAFAKALENVPELKGVLTKILAGAGGATIGAASVMAALLPSHKPDGVKEKPTEAAPD